MTDSRKQRICKCMEPIELPDMTCGRCHLRRFGDDLTSEQTSELAAALVPLLITDEVEPEPRTMMKRYHGRKRRSEVIT